MGTSLSVLQASLDMLKINPGVRGANQRVPEGNWSVLGASLGVLGNSLVELRASLAALGGNLGAPKAVWVCRGAI